MDSFYSYCVISIDFLVDPASERILIATSIGKNGNTTFNIDEIVEGSWYSFILKQKGDHKSDFYFQVLLNGEERINVLNPVPLSFSNISVFAASKFHPAADGFLKNVEAFTEPDGIFFFK